MWKILIADDQAIVRQGLKAMLEQDEQITVTHVAENGHAAIQILEKNHLIDLVLMDVRMPVMNGMEATQIIKNKWPHVKVLILTTFNDEQYALETLKDGASGFLLKTADSKKLIAAVYSVMQDGLPIQEEVAAKVIPNLLKRRNDPKVAPAVSLTEREVAIVKLVGEGKTNKEIAGVLFLSIGTVKNHITTILQKVECRDRTQLAIFAVKHHLT
jgi:DNA-binding NarL/FixJ family response regulator